MRILVAGWIGSANLGDEMVFGGLAAKLAARGVEVTAVSTDVTATAALHGVEAVGHASVGAAVRALSAADGLVFGGGGLVQDETSPYNLPYHLSRVWLARLAGRPWVGVGLGAGPVDTAVGRGLARTVRSAVAVSARDEPSARLLRRLGAREVVVAADLALSLPAPRGVDPDRLVVALRPWEGRRRRLPVGWGRGPQAPSWFVEEAARALDRAAEATGLTVRFVAFDASRDDPVHRQVAVRMRSHAEVAAPGLDEVLGEVVRGRLVVGMRYHAGIAALLAGRPAVLLGYSPKVAALAADAGPGVALLDWRGAGLARLPHALEAVAGRGADVVGARERLREREAGNDRVLDRLLEVAGS